MTKWLYQALGASFNENQLVIGSTGIIYIAEDNGSIYALQDFGVDNPPSILFSFNTGYTTLLPPVIGTNNIMFFAETNIIKAAQNINTSSPSVLWSLSITSPPLTNPKSPIIGANNTIYLSTSNGYIFAINNINVNGALKWSYNISGSNNVSNLAIGSDGTIYATAYRYMYAVTDNGSTYSLKWQSGELMSSVGLSAPSVGPDGTIYTMYNNIIYAIKASDGTKKWNSDLTVGSLSLTGFISISNSGKLYVVSKTTINSINDNGSSGTVNWICTTNSDLTSVAIGNNGAIYSTGDYGAVIRITDNGDTSFILNWSIQPTSSGYSSPCAISNNGTIYYGGDHGYIVAIN
jgi:outer membrane protein assembly factor BamB